MTDGDDYEIPLETDPDLFDAACDPTSPVAVSFSLVREAAARVQGKIKNTRCEKSQLSHECGIQLFFKKEFEQRTGSFKDRGACNVLWGLSKKEKERGVIAASSGNHAAAMSYHGLKSGTGVTVVMPSRAPLPKIKACRNFGASLILKGNSIAEARRLALKIAKQTGKFYVNGYDHPNIIAGQGTIGLEILEQVPQVDAIIVPVGGGGLIAGIALAVKTLKPHVKIYGVESDQCPSFAHAIREGKPTYTPCENTVADGLLVPEVGINAFETCKNLIDRMVAIDESFAFMGILKILEAEKSVVEGAGAVSYGAILAGCFPELAGKTVVCVLGGGNIDAILLTKVLDRALALESRIISMSLTISDRVGGIAELLTIIRDAGACIREVFHKRCWVGSDVFKVKVRVDAETKDKKHADYVYSVLLKHYSTVHWKTATIV